MLILKYVMPLVIGAVIGYFTNYLAVKMLFRPLHPVKIGNKTLPFTPGIIPKGKPRLAKALGNAVGNTLLTEADIKNVLLSESMKKTVREYALSFTESKISVKELAQKTMSQEKYDEIKLNISNMLVEKIMTTADEINLGNIIAEKGGDAVREKVAGTMLAMFIKDELINSLCASLGDKVNDYIKDNGRDIISPMIENEAENLESKSISEIISEAGGEPEKLADAFVEIYSKFIDSHSENLIKNFNISEIVEQKVNEMDVLVLEDLLLSIMKKELNAVVNLGALIGFIIGAINILF